MCRVPFQDLDYSRLVETYVESGDFCRYDDKLFGKPHAMCLICTKGSLKTVLYSVPQRQKEKTTPNPFSITDL